MLMVNIQFIYRYNVDTLFLVDDLKLFTAIINRQNSERNTENNRVKNVYTQGNYIIVELNVTESTYRKEFTNRFVSDRACIRTLIKMYENK